MQLVWTVGRVVRMQRGRGQGGSRWIQGFGRKACRLYNPSFCLLGPSSFQRSATNAATTSSLRRRQVSMGWFAEASAFKRLA